MLIYNFFVKKYNKIVLYNNINVYIWCIIKNREDEKLRKIIKKSC
jgi:galactokinase/mevalonate kinase-like predicted kinase